MADRKRPDMADRKRPEKETMHKNFQNESGSSAELQISECLFFFFLTDFCDNIKGLFMQITLHVNW